MNKSVDKCAVYGIMVSEGLPVRLLPPLNVIEITVCLEIAGGYFFLLLLQMVYTKPIIATITLQKRNNVSQVMYIRITSPHYRGRHKKLWTSSDIKMEKATAPYR